MEIIQNQSVYFNKRKIQLPVSNGHGLLKEPKYIVVHSTANLGAPAINHVNLWANDDTYAVHYVGDWTGKVYHCVPDNRICWQVGNANPYVIGIELCEPAKYTDFEKVWNVGIEWSVYMLKKKGWGIDRLLSHKDCTERFGGSDHTDPIPFFAKWGRTWEQFKKEVSERMEDDMPSVEEIWGYKIKGVSAEERLYLDNQQLFDRTDYSGRGKDGVTPIERLSWMAAKQEKMQESINNLVLIVDDLRDIVLRLKAGK